MKYIYALSLTLLFAFGSQFTLEAQSPNRMTYQAVIRNAQGDLVVSQGIRTRISILKGSSSGTVVFSELHISLTNANGLVTFVIGGGSNISGSISSIN